MGTSNALRKKTRYVLTLIIGGAIQSYLLLSCATWKKPGRLDSYEASERGKWYRVDLGSEAVSADGSDFYLLSRKGAGDDLMIFFSGGGAAWDAESASQPMNLENLLKGKGLGLYFANIHPMTMHMLGGILDVRNSANPFKDWNVAYIPYSTGDFHTGDRVADFRYGDADIRMRFNGRKNVESSLRWVFENHRSPRKVFVLGESAGAFGAAFWLPRIAERYPDSEIYLLSDGAYIETEKWPSLVDGVWGARWEETFGWKPGADLIREAFIADYRSLGDRVTYMHDNTLYDGIVSEYQARLEGTYGASFDPRASSRTWSEGLRRSMRAIRDSVPGYCYFLTDAPVDPKKGTTTHTLLRFDIYFEAEEEGKKYVDWVKDVVIEGKRYSVGASLLDGEGER